MERHNRFKDIPHFNLIRENGTITIPSVFMFKGGCQELFSFLAACAEYNCTVFFNNEDIEVSPSYDTAIQLKLITYMSIVESPKIANDYMRFLNNFDSMRWEGVR